MRDRADSDYDVQSSDEDGETEEVPPFYTGFIATARTVARDDIVMASVATEDTLQGLAKTYFSEFTSIQQYTVKTGRESPHALMAFHFESNEYYRQAELGRNHVMQVLFRDVFIHEGSNPFHHGIFGSVVACYIDAETGCPSANM